MNSRELEQRGTSPYSSKELNGIIEELFYYLTEVFWIKNLKIKKSGNSSSLLSITADIPNSAINKDKELANELIQLLRTNISLDSFSHTIEIDQRRIIINFITWDFQYVTGKIILSKID